jgi:DNA-binding NtrC family response regulator
MRVAPSSKSGLNLARVLLDHGELAPRLTLQTILQAGGYAVDVAGTSSEAVAKLDTNRYALVLSDSTPGNENLLAYARVKDYHPATAMITSHEPALKRQARRGAHEFSIRTLGVPNLLEKVADLIGVRASRRYRQAV